MKFIVLLFAAATVYLSDAQEEHSRYIREPQEASRRQAVSYTTKVLHQDPNHPDQTAESTVKVNFNPSQTVKPSTKVTRQVAYPSQPYQRNPYVNNNLQQQQSLQNYVQPRQIQSSPQSQSQLFNVGYSMSFSNNALAQKSTRNQNLDEAEIITGIRKQNEQVAIPQELDPSPQEYVTNALQDQKQKISGIKPKTKYTQAIRPFANLKAILQSANLAPITQKYLKALQHIKSMFKPDLKNNWRNLSPGVEIYKSRELPINAVAQAPGNPRLGLYDQYQIYQKRTKQTGTPQLVPTTGGNEPYSQLPISLPPITDQRGQQGSTTSTVGFKYPIDTRLLREPVLTTDSKSVGTDSKTIPIVIDTRLVQQAMQNQVGQYQLQQYADDSASSQSQQQLLGTTAYQQGYQNNYLQNNNYAQNLQLRVAEEPRINQVNNYQQYKAHGNSQPVNNQAQINFSTLKNQYVKDLYSNVDNVNQRQPRGRSSDYGLQTNLRPPPMNHNYQRRMLIGI